MSRSCTRDQVREIDRKAIVEYGMPGVILMENAGRGAARIAADMLRRPRGKRAVIFCGKGNNGGDGYVIARHLHNLGTHVHIVLACDPEAVPLDSEAGVNLVIARNMGLHCHVAVSDAAQTGAAALARSADLIIDALLGTGLSGEVREPCLSLIRLINAADKPVLSVDIPSGLDTDTGNILRAAVRASATATFVLPKRGFELEEGPGHVGECHVVDIGVPRELIEEVLSQDMPAPD